MKIFQVLIMMIVVLSMTGCIGVPNPDFARTDFRETKVRGGTVHPALMGNRQITRTTTRSTTFYGYNSTFQGRGNTWSSGAYAPQRQLYRCDTCGNTFTDPNTHPCFEGEDAVLRTLDCRYNHRHVDECYNYDRGQNHRDQHRQNYDGSGDTTIINNY